MNHDSTAEEEEEARFLERARAGLGPSAAQRRATLARLSASLAVLTAPGPATPPFQSAGAPAALDAVGRYSLRALIAGVLTGAVVGFGAGYAVSSRAREERPPVTPSSEERHARTPVTARLFAPAPVPPASADSKSVGDLSPSADSRSVEEAMLTQEREPPKRPKTSARPASSAQPVEPTFYEELSYVRRAQAALRQNNGLLALGLMQSLDEVRPKGALMAERNVTRVLALCALGRSEEAARVARAAARDDTVGIYARRLASSCVGADELGSESKKQ